MTMTDEFKEKSECPLERTKYEGYCLLENNNLHQRSSQPCAQLPGCKTIIRMFNKIEKKENNNDKSNRLE